MKHLILNFKQGFILSLLLTLGTNINAQTSEQARAFINRSHIAIMKVEKEMYKANDNTNSAELKKAVKYQLIATNLFKENKFKEALGYSYKSRSQCMDLLTRMGIAEGAWYNLNDDEKAYCKPTDYASYTLQTNLLDNAQNNEVDNIDVLDVQKFHQLVLNIK